MFFYRSVGFEKYGIGAVNSVTSLLAHYKPLLFFIFLGNNGNLRLRSSKKVSVVKITASFLLQFKVHKFPCSFLIA
jgi:hypothetical protein